MIRDVICLIGGLAVLLIAGDVLVRGAVGLAVRFAVPPMITGLTIVAFGTSAPELLVSLDSALQGIGGIAVGNVVGSNIANILLVLGLPSVFLATSVQEQGLVRNTLVMIMITVIFIAIAASGQLSRLSGLAFLAMLVLFLLDQYRRAQAHRRETSGEADLALGDMSDAPKSLWLALGLTLVGIVGLPIGANLTVDGAVATARLLGVSDTAIALTVIAIGTSLPELAATLMAAIRGKAGVGLGNVIGSNIFNLLAIVGITAVIVPIKVPRELALFDFWVMLASALLLAAFAMARQPIGRLSGSAMTLLYIGYIVMVAYFGSGYAAMRFLSADMVPF